MTARRSGAMRHRGLWGARTGQLIAGAGTILVLVLASPAVMAALSRTSLPWGRLADVGDAFGGVSALLSAIALCGIGASLIFQQRQVRQELANMDRQQHVEIAKLAIDNPELIEVLMGTPAGSRTRQEIYANLAVMYWLAIWELGEIDDDELRAMAATMFGSEVTRRWWGRVGEGWIGTQSRPGRRRFLSIVTEQSVAAEASARSGATRKRGRPGTTFVLSLAAVAVVVGARRVQRRQR